MTRSFPTILSMAFALGLTAPLYAQDIKPRQVDPTVGPERIARTDDSMAKSHQVAEKDVPVSFIKSEYNDFMTNVAWINRNGFVVGAPAWKGGEDGLHCH